MKKFLKKLLLCLIVIPAMFFMFACNTPEPPSNPQTPGTESSQTPGSGNSQTPGDGGSQTPGEGGSRPGGSGEGNGGAGNPGNTPVDPVAAAKNAAYAIIKNLAQDSLSILAIDKELDITKSVLQADSRYELTNIALTEEEWDTEVEKKGLFGDFVRQSESPYYGGCYKVALSSDGNGYYLEKNGFSFAEMETVFRDAVVSHDDKFVFVDNYNSAYYVDNNYAPHEYLYDFTNNDFNLVNVFKTIGETDSYENLPTTLLSIITGVSKNYNPAYVVEVPLNITVEINILGDSKYELVINSKYATKYNGTAAVGYNKYEHVSYTNYVITFDSTSLISIDMIDGEYMFPMTWEYNDLKDILKGKSAFALNFDDVFSTNSVVRSRRDNYERLNIKFNEINTNLFPTEESTSKDFDELQKAKFYFYFYLVVDGQPQYSNAPFATLEYGQQLIAPNNAYPAEEYDYFLDAAGTQPIEVGTVIPSYGIGTTSIFVIAKNQ